MDNCVFCKIINNELPSEVLYSDDSVIVFKNIAPVAEHHYLVCPKKHISKFTEVGDEIKDMSEACKNLISKFDIEDGYKLVINGGKYQSVPHLHWHLLAGKLEDNDDILNQT